MVIGVQGQTIHLFRPFHHFFKFQTAEGLPVFHHERYIVGAHFHHRPGALVHKFIGSVPSKAGVEKTRVMGAKFTAIGFISNHFRQPVGPDAHPFLRHHYIKTFRFQNQSILFVSVNRLPEFIRLVMPDFG